VEGETDTDNDQSSADGDDGIDYQELCQTVVQIGKENMSQKGEKLVGKHSDKSQKRTR